MNCTIDLTVQAVLKLVDAASKIADQWTSFLDRVSTNCWQTSAPRPKSYPQQTAAAPGEVAMQRSSSSMGGGQSSPRYEYDERERLTTDDEALVPLSRPRGISGLPTSSLELRASSSGLPRSAPGLLVTPPGPATMQRKSFRPVTVATAVLVHTPE